MNISKPITQPYLAAILSLFSLASEAQITPALVDFDAYENLVSEVKLHRQSHLLNAKEFVKASKEQKVIILDTRSDSMYAAVHVKGAIHLNFSDFTHDNLRKIIPSPDYKILIYCNNNFVSSPPPMAPLSQQLKKRDYEPYFVSKVSRPESFDFPEKTKKQAKAQARSAKGFNEGFSESPPISKPITLALNIPTYINLYGYGYRNVYELSELVNTYDDVLEFEGTAVHQ